MKFAWNSWFNSKFNHLSVQMTGTMKPSHFKHSHITAFNHYLKACDSGLNLLFEWLESWRIPKRRRKLKQVSCKLKEVMSQFHQFSPSNNGLNEDWLAAQTFSEGRTSEQWPKSCISIVLSICVFAIVQLTIFFHLMSKFIINMIKKMVVQTLTLQRLWWRRLKLHRKWVPNAFEEPCLCLWFCDLGLTCCFQRC